jgi:D-sedoheptulose 7-phosphate isomerase
MTREAFGRAYVQGVVQVLGALPWEAIGQVLAELERAWSRQSNVLIAGNGGSAATASHTANDLIDVGRKLGVRGLGTVALADKVPTLTAIANDDAYAEVFAAQIELIGRPGDLLMVFSASGNSPNIVRAVESARGRGMRTVAFLGMGGGAVAGLVDLAVVVPSDEYGPIEDVHMVLDHLMSSYLSSWLERNGDPRP